MWRISQQMTRTAQCTSSAATTPAVLSSTSVVSPRHQIVRRESKAATSSESSPPPPPPPSGGSGGWFWKMLSLTVVSAGGVVGYAWYDNGFRKTIETNVPYSKDALGYIFKYLPASPTPSPEPSKKKAEHTSMAKNTEVIPARSTPAKEVAPSKTAVSPAAAAADIAAPVALKVESKKSQEETNKRVAEEKKRQDKERAERTIREQEEKELNENKELEFLIEKLTGDSVRAVETAISSFKTASQAIRTHNQQLKQAMESTSTESQWVAATDTHHSRADAIRASESANDRAKQNIEKLRETIVDGKAKKSTKKNKTLLSAESEHNKLSNALSSAAAELSKAQAEAKVVAEYRNLVKEGKEKFKKELESILPDVKLGEKKGRLTEDELNSLIAHAHRRVEQLQRQLAEQQTMEQQRIESALERQKEEDEKLADGRVARELGKISAEVDVVKQKWDAEARVEFEKELRAQLSRQAAAHSDHIIEVIKVQQKELEGRFGLRLAESIDAEREAFQRQVMSWVARLHGIEAAVSGRADLEKQGRKAQELWLACQTLQSAVASASGLPAYAAAAYETQLKPLKNEIVAVREAGDGNPYVATVLASVPEAATHRGVWTEAALVERFHKVASIGRRVAMIGTNPPTLFRYFLSYLQSIFVLRSARVLSRDHLIVADELDAFALLDNASTCIEHGDLEQAVRFVNALRGEPRRAASDWLTEARLLLETRQAADALLAFATAAGLASLF